MAIVLEQSFHTAVDTPSGSATTASWTPGSNELCLCFVAMRSGSAPDTNVSGVSGNGLTWVKVISVDDTQNVINLTVYRAMGASPSAGGVTVTFALDPTAASIQLMRFSGVKTTGTNGSGAIGNTASADTGASDTTPATTSVTTSATNSRVVGLAANRGQTITVGSGFTAILINQTANSGGSVIRSNTEYKDVASSGASTTVNFSLSSAGDWVIAAIEILQDTGTTYNQTVSGAITPTGALLKATTKKTAGSTAPFGALRKRATRALAGSITLAGALASARAYLKALAGSLAPAGALITQRVKFLSGTVGASGALAKTTLKTLAGALTPVGSVARAAVDAIIRQRRRGTIYQQNKLAFLVTAPPWSNSGYATDHTQDVTSYDHTHAALGGFWSANLTMRLPLHDLEEWMEYGVGRQVQVKGRGTKTAWEGIVNRVTVNVGGYNMTVGPYLDIANKVKLAYSIFLQLGGGNATGIRVVTEPTSNLSSQAKYGILAKVFSVGGIDSSAVAGLQAMLLERYSQPPRSEDLNLPGDTGLRYIDLKLECIGYAHLLQKYTYNSTTAGTQNLSAKLAAIVAAEPNALFSSSVATNTIQVPAGQTDDAEAWGLIKSMIAMGDTSLNRYTFGVYENRRVTYKAVDNNVVYVRPLREGASVIQDAQGGLLQPWEVRPGSYVLVTDLLPGKPVASDLNDEQRAIYADTVQYRMPDSLVINGAHAFRIEQRMAQMGLSGVS
jgi:hypothetical protein